MKFVSDRLGFLIERLTSKTGVKSQNWITAPFFRDK